MAKTAKQKKETRGVLLIALGNPNYGKMAFTLAASIKYSSPDMPIHVVCNESAMTHLNSEMLGYFDSVQMAPHDCYHRNNNLEYIKAKTWMYNLSPFDTTIFLDVDMIWLSRKPITQLFDELAAIDYTIQNRDFIDMADKNINPGYSLWANVIEVKEKYKFTKGKYYSLHSEFVYFKKSTKNKLFFDEWIKQYDNLKVNHTVFANGIPDELPLAIASVIKEQYPHQDAFLPIYWARAEQPIERNSLQEDFFGYSIGGNHLRESQIRDYNDFQKFYANKQGRSIIFKTESKAEYLNERSNY